MDAFECSERLVRILSEKDLSGEELRFAVACRSLSGLARALEQVQSDVESRIAEVIAIGSAAVDVGAKHDADPLTRIAQITKLAQARAEALFEVQRGIEQASIECMKSRTDSWRVTESEFAKAKEGS